MHHETSGPKIRITPILRKPTIRFLERQLERVQRYRESPKPILSDAKTYIPEEIKILKQLVPLYENKAMHQELESAKLRIYQLGILQAI